MYTTDESERGLTARRPQHYFEIVETVLTWLAFSVAGNAEIAPRGEREQ